MRMGLEVCLGRSEELKGRTAIVTGGATGIGAVVEDGACAEGFESDVLPCSEA